MTPTPDLGVDQPVSSVAREALPNSICECGLAKSYHPRLADHEYRPRYLVTPAGPEERGEGLREAGLVRCPLCGDPERTEDIVGGVCLTCADGIAFSQNARRGSIEVAATPAPDTGAEERLRAALERLDAKKAEYDAAEKRDADANDWQMADRWRYIASGIETALTEVRAALHDSASSGTREEGT